jgi:hypothetical protein
MIEPTRAALLTTMHTQAFAYARQLLFARRARANGHPGLADALEAVAETEFLAPFAEAAGLTALVGTDLENLETVTRESPGLARHAVLRAARDNLRAAVPGPESHGSVAAGLPERDQDLAC